MAKFLLLLFYIVNKLIFTYSNEETNIIFADEVLLIRRDTLKNKNKSKLLSIQNITNKYVPKIPLIIHQIWPVKILPTNMNKTVTELLFHNPEFQYRLYDDKDCAHVIKRHFDKHTFYSFENLRPGAYKADLCRYCLLYHYGGIYLDIKMKIIDNFKLILLTDREYYVLDRYGHPYGNYTLGLYNAVMINQKHSPVLKKAIEIVNRNVKNKYYGLNYLYPTGPVVLGEAYIGSEDDVKRDIHKALEKVRELDLVNTAYNHTTLYTRVQYHDLPILRPYSEYRTEQKSFYSSSKEHKHYSWYWFQGKVYDD